MDSHTVPFAQVDTTINPQAFVHYLDTVSANAQIQQLKRQTYTLLALQPGQMILDVGCGTGEDVRNLAELVGSTGKVVGVDKSATMIATARERSGGFGAPLDFQQADITQLPFADATFDGVRTERVFQHLSDRRAALAELVRVTKPGGHIVVTDTDQGMTAGTASNRVLTRRILTFQDDDTQNGWSGRELPGLFQQAGLTQIQVVPFVLQIYDFRQFDELSNLSKDLQYAQRRGILAADDIATWMADVAAVSERQEFFAAIVVFSVVGQRS
jgi:ubiquinone/menaquinone biosynthesis C-methylase UbiE